VEEGGEREEAAGGAKAIKHGPGGAKHLDRLIDGAADNLVTRSPENRPGAVLMGGFALARLIRRHGALSANPPGPGWRVS
jgi:hypothetical protein